MYQLVEQSVSEARASFTQTLKRMASGEDIVVVVRKRGDEPQGVIMPPAKWSEYRRWKSELERQPAKVRSSAQDTLGMTNTVADAIVREETCARENGPADDRGATQETPDAGEVSAEQEQVPEEVTNKLAEAIVREEACAQENAPADDSGAAQETPKEVGELPAEQEEMPEEAMNHIRDRVHESLLRGIPCNTVVRALVESYSTLGITNTVAEAIVREEACAQENEPADDSGATQETRDAGELPAEQAESPGDRPEPASADQEARQPPLPEGANLELPEGFDPPESYARKYLSEGYEPAVVFRGLNENYEKYGLTPQDAKRIVTSMIEGGGRS